MDNPKEISVETLQIPTDINEQIKTCFSDEEWTQFTSNEKIKFRVLYSAYIDDPYFHGQYSLREFLLLKPSDQKRFPHITGSPIREPSPIPGPSKVQGVDTDFETLHISSSESDKSEKKLTLEELWDKSDEDHAKEKAAEAAKKKKVMRKPFHKLAKKGTRTSQVQQKKIKKRGRPTGKRSSDNKKPAKKTIKEIKTGDKPKRGRPRKKRRFNLPSPPACFYHNKLSPSNVINFPLSPPRDLKPMAWDSDQSSPVVIKPVKKYDLTDSVENSNDVALDLTIPTIFTTVAVSYRSPVLDLTQPTLKYTFPAILHEPPILDLTMPRAKYNTPRFPPPISPFVALGDQPSTSSGIFATKIRQNTFMKLPPPLALLRPSTIGSSFADYKNKGEITSFKGTEYAAYMQNFEEVVGRPRLDHRDAKERSEKTVPSQKPDENIPSFLTNPLAGIGFYVPRTDSQQNSFSTNNNPTETRKGAKVQTQELKNIKSSVAIEESEQLPLPVDPIKILEVIADDSIDLTKPGPIAKSEPMPLSEDNVMPTTKDISKILEVIGDGSIDLMKPDLMARSDTLPLPENNAVPITDEFDISKILEVIGDGSIDLIKPDLMARSDNLRLPENNAMPKTNEFHISKILEVIGDGSIDLIKRTATFSEPVSQIVSTISIDEVKKEKPCISSTVSLTTSPIVSELAPIVPTPALPQQTLDVPMPGISGLVSSNIPKEISKPTIAKITVAAPMKVNPELGAKPKTSKLEANLVDITSPVGTHAFPPKVATIRLVSHQKLKMIRKLRPILPKSTSTRQINSSPVVSSVSSVKVSKPFTDITKRCQNQKNMSKPRTVGLKPKRTVIKAHSCFSGTSFAKPYPAAPKKTVTPKKSSSFTLGVSRSDLKFDKKLVKVNYKLLHAAKEPLPTHLKLPSSTESSDSDNPKKEKYLALSNFGSTLKTPDKPSIIPKPEPLTKLQDTNLPSYRQQDARPATLIPKHIRTYEEPAKRGQIKCQNLDYSDEPVEEVITIKFPTSVDQAQIEALSSAKMLGFPYTSESLSKICPNIIRKRKYIPPIPPRTFHELSTMPISLPTVPFKIGDVEIRPTTVRRTQEEGSSTRFVPGLLGTSITRVPPLIPIRRLTRPKPTAASIIRTSARESGRVPHVQKMVSEVQSECLPKMVTVSIDTDGRVTVTETTPPKKTNVVRATPVQTTPVQTNTARKTPAPIRIRSSSGTMSKNSSASDFSNPSESSVQATWSELEANATKRTTLISPGIYKVVRTIPCFGPSTRFYTEEEMIAAEVMTNDLKTQARFLHQGQTLIESPSTFSYVLSTGSISSTRSTSTIPSTVYDEPMDVDSDLAEGGANNTSK